MRLRRRSKGEGEAQKALNEAEEHLQRVKSRSDEVKRVADGLRTLRVQNHFREQLEAIMGGKT